MMDFIKGLPFEISFIDAFLGGFLLLAALHGLVRGLLKEFLTPVVWLGAGLLAFRYVYDVAPFLGQWIDSSAIRLIVTGVAMGIVFVMAGNLMINLLSNFLHSFGLGGTNRLLGLLFGLTWGSLLLIILIGFLGGSLDKVEWWRDSRIIATLAPHEASVSRELWRLVGIYKQQLDIAEQN